MAAGNRAIWREAQRRRGVRKRPPYRPVEAVSRAETTYRTPVELFVEKFLRLRSGGPKNGSVQ